MFSFRDDSRTVQSRMDGLSIGTSVDVRPMTAVSGAGYQSQSFGSRQEKKQKQATVKSSPQKIARQMEKEIHRLLESSAQTIDDDPFLALQKAKEAAEKENALSTLRKNNPSLKQKGDDLHFATRFNLAVAYEHNDMLLDAIETYSLLLKRKGCESCSTLVRINMGNIYISQQNHAQAIKMYRMALDQTTREEKGMKFRIHRTIGNILVEIGKLRDAILDYEAVSMRADADVETSFNLLLCYAQIGEVEKAKQTFLRILSAVKSSNRSSRSEKTDPNIGTQQLNFDKTVEISGKEPEALLLIAARLICSMDNGNEDWKAAYRWVKDQLSEKNPTVFQQIEMEQALQHLRKGEFDYAIKLLKSFESKDVALRATVATNLSFLYFLEGDYDVADEYADIALASNRFNSNALVNKGNSLFIRDEHQKAKDLYVEAIGVEATNFEAIYNLGLANIRLGSIAEAIHAFERLHSVTTNDPRVLYHVANLYEQNGDSVSALKWFNVLSARLPSDQNVLSRIGNLYSEQGDDTQSLHYYLESHRLYPSNLDIIGWLAVWFVKHEMYEKSIHFFKRASRIQPNEIKWKFMIASCFRRLLRYTDAYELYEQIRKTHPGNVDCLKYLVGVCKDLHIDSTQYEEEIQRLEL